LRSEKEKQSFQTGLLKSEVREFTEKCRELEQDVPSEYGDWSLKILRIVDCEVTLKSLKPANHFNQSVREREEHDKILKKLMMLLKPMTDEEIEASAEVEGLVVRLEYLNDQIVERDRTKHFRHRPCFTPVCELYPEIWYITFCFITDSPTGYI
jgi:hypothetical protein